MRLKLDARALGAIRRMPRVNVYSLLELALLALLAVQCARLVWTVATPISPLGDWRPAVPGYAGAPGTVLRGFDPFFRNQQNQAAAQAVTSLQLTLFGTRVNEATGGGSAIIAGQDGVQQSYAIGDEVAPGVTLKQVAFDHVVLDRGGASENLFIDQSDTGAGDSAPPPGQVSLAGDRPVAVSPDSQTSAPAQPDGTGMTLSDIRSGIGFIPRIDNGKVTGLVLRPQGSGDVFRRAGLQPGDIAVEIQGKRITGAQDIQNAAAAMAKGGILSLNVERGSRVVPIGISVTGP